jgi:hypothetical protein
MSGSRLAVEVLDLTHQDVPPQVPISVPTHTLLFTMKEITLPTWIVGERCGTFCVP